MQGYINSVIMLLVFVSGNSAIIDCRLGNLASDLFLRKESFAWWMIGFTFKDEASENKALVLWAQRTEFLGVISGAWNHLGSDNIPEEATWACRVL